MSGRNGEAGKRPLNSDELGAKGEARFEEICADQKLVCNKSTRDRTGWDYIVEFPFEPTLSSTVSLDRRENPVSCHVQVKTIWDHREVARLRLSSAERLAKEAKPSFICLFRVASNLTFTDAYLFHMLDHTLARVLKRLREEYADGKLIISQQTITMNIRDGIHLEPNGIALRSAIQAAIGPDFATYMVRKREQFQNLGMDIPPYRGKIRMLVPPEVDFVDIFLGLEKNVAVKDFQTWERRFGIELPHPTIPNAGVAKVTIRPHPIDKCQVVSRTDDDTPPGAFNGELIIPWLPRLPPDRRKLLVTTDLFSLVIGTNDFSFEFRVSEENVKGARQTPEVWASYWRLLRMLAIGKGVIEIRPARTPAFDLEIGESTIDLTKESCEAMIKLCEAASYMLRSAGVPNSPLLTWEQLGKSNALAAQAVARGEASNFRFKTEHPRNIKVLPLKIILGNWCSLGDTIIAYAVLARVVATVIEQSIEWVSTEYKLHKVTVIQNDTKDLHRFLSAAQTETNADGYFAPLLSIGAREPT